MTAEPTTARSLTPGADAPTSRRRFLQGASAGAAAVGAAALVPVGRAAASPAEDHSPAHDGPFLAWVSDARTGEITVLAGEHELVHRDRALARRLARIAAQASRS